MSEEEDKQRLNDMFNRITNMESRMETQLTMMATSMQNHQKTCAERVQNVIDYVRQDLKSSADRVENLGDMIVIHTQTIQEQNEKLEELKHELNLACSINETKIAQLEKQTSDLASFIKSWFKRIGISGAIVWQLVSAIMVVVSSIGHQTQGLIAFIQEHQTTTIFIGIGFMILILLAIPYLVKLFKRVRKNGVNNRKNKKKNDKITNLI